MAVRRTDSQAKLRSRVIRELNRQGYLLTKSAFSRNGENPKEFIRAKHARQRRDRLRTEARLVIERGPDLIQDFARGSEIQPTAIDPELVSVEASLRPW